MKNLTKREIEVLLLISKGYVNKDISNELKITERTVKNHVSSIFRKINVNDRTQAAVFAVKNSELFQNDGFM
uniref:response regulator transcription factor n=1 Tax=Eshraghiella crossota TaxID=45851 RepID=UPI004029B5D2